MKFALIDGNRTEAIKGAQGICPVCSGELIAKCGEVKINHWAHKGIRKCDTWWEPETEWHRSWKNYFPIEWQENPLIDEQTGEKHIADICTSYRFIAEFQHSHINPQERRSREQFYGNMVWLVDGTRLQRDYNRFLKGKDYWQIVKKGVFRVNFPEEFFPAAWLNSSVPVIFDFKGNEIISDPLDMRNSLYCLFPVQVGVSVTIAQMSSATFIDSIISGKWLERISHFMNDLNQMKQEYQNQVAIRENWEASMMFRKFGRTNRYPRSRRF